MLIGSKRMIEAIVPIRQNAPTVTKRHAVANLFITMLVPVFLESVS